MPQEIDPTRAKPPLPISLANILNFKYGMSSNSVIPAPAYARAGMTATETTKVQTSCPDTTSLTKGRLKTPKYAFQTTSPISPEPAPEKC
ncbi:hypothetical protein [Neisseria sicca]|jgi:hypothetical protein|uniref:hypothetical protein n=1 Tax=Neisseria sicca TaxID=490 RepID=UPI000D321798|nr:hypothetical protein [Neisseria sicca]